MRTLLKIIIFVPLFFQQPINGQNLHTNAPELVFPVLEEFISENHLRGTATFEKINFIDSIVVRDIPLIIEDHIIKKVYGRRHRRGKYTWIEIDSSLIQFPQKFEKTLTHELGHVFGLPHIDPGGLPYSNPIYSEIMCVPSLPYYIEPKVFKKAKYNFYKSLQNTPQ